MDDTNIEGPSRALAPLKQGGNVAAIVPQTFDDVYRFARVLANSGLTPYGMNNPDKCAVALFTGLELGLPPMQAIQSIAVIGGRPSLWGDTMIALVRRSGELESMKESFVGTVPTSTNLAEWPDDFGAKCIVKRKGYDPVEYVFTVFDAKIAKLWMKKGREGGDTPWITNPKRMLQWRARAFAIRDNFQDALRGIAMAEEMQDVVEDVSFREVESPPSVAPVEDVASQREIARPDREGGASVPASNEKPIDWEARLADLNRDLDLASDPEAARNIGETHVARFGGWPQEYAERGRLMAKARAEHLIYQVELAAEKKRKAEEAAKAEAAKAQKDSTEQPKSDPPPANDDGVESEPDWEAELKDLEEECDGLETEDAVRERLEEWLADDPPPPRSIRSRAEALAQDRIAFLQKKALADAKTKVEARASIPEEPPSVDEEPPSVEAPSQTSGDPVDDIPDNAATKGKTRLSEADLNREIDTRLSALRKAKDLQSLNALAIKVEEWLSGIEVPKEDAEMIADVIAKRRKLLEKTK